MKSIAILSMMICVLIAMPVVAVGSRSVTVSAEAALTARRLSFDKTTIAVPPGVEVEVVLQNRGGAAHSFSVYETESAESVLFRGEQVAPGMTRTCRFVSPEEPGRYYFQCDLHPESMNGDFIVSSGDTVRERQRKSPRGGRGGEY